MESFDSENFETASHSDELDFLYEQNSDDIEKAIFDSRDYFHDLKMHLKLLRKHFFGVVREKMQKNLNDFEQEEVKKEVSESVLLINITDIEPGEGQPRKNFDKDKQTKIKQLTEQFSSLDIKVNYEESGDNYFYTLYTPRKVKQKRLIR